MHLVERAVWEPPDDEARLVEFGPPIFGFVPQPRLQERGWSWCTSHGVTLEAEAHYWLADRTGNFWFEDSPGGPVGIAELRGFVFTDRPGSTNRGGDPIRDALNQHLQYVVMNYTKNPHEFGSKEWADLHTRQQHQVEQSLAQKADLPVDHKLYPAIAVTVAEFRATTAAISGRVVTVVIHESDNDKIEPVLTRRL
ncbi:hypothetical protein [Cryobacterium roopkundense]|uniref:Uncharacterized protein n=1 Tax=Cryobacterium roopkundense TaxID=1001240 RepID=A0A7W9E3L4_9MICO|nr:hypothetical protein [Cryobacterium roopkundense]MBB5641288.1 hypothetical protein [Cryobacterium roopkundense]